MTLIDVKYVRAEQLTIQEKKELGIPRVESGLVAIHTTNPNLKRVGILIENYSDYLHSLK